MGTTFSKHLPIQIIIFPVKMPLVILYIVSYNLIQRELQIMIPVMETQAHPCLQEKIVNRLLFCLALFHLERKIVGQAHRVCIRKWNRT